MRTNFYRRISVLILSAVLAVSCFTFPVAAKEGSAFDLVIEAPAGVEAGGELELVVKVRNITAKNGLCAVQFTLYFDKDKVEPKLEGYDTVTACPTYKSAGVESKRYESIIYTDAEKGFIELKYLDCPEYNTADYGCDGVQGVKADDALIFTVPFAVKTAASGGELKFDIKTDASETLGTDPGDWDGKSFDAAGRASYTVAPFSVSGKGASVSVAVAGGTLGDVNADGDIDSMDASLILQSDAGLTVLSAQAASAADVNGDGDIDAMDASLILQYDAGLISGFKK